MDGTQWECNSSDTLLNDFFSQDDLKQLAVDAGIMLECPLLVLDDTFHVVAYYYPPGFVDNIFQEAEAGWRRMPETAQEIPAAIPAERLYLQD